MNKLASNDQESAISTAVGKSGSAAAWPAIFAGAFVTISLSVILFALGAGLGLAEASPWPGRGASATALTAMTAVWLMITQWISAGIGGFVAGRLRTRWTGVHSHEVFFRDTAHGLITWSVATTAVAAVAAFVAMGPGAHAAATAPSLVTSTLSSYEIDRFLRPSGGAAGKAAPAETYSEINHIVGKAAAEGGVISDSDSNYLAQLAATNSGLSTTEAQQRVHDLGASIADSVQRAKAAAQAARKAVMLGSLYLTLSLLIGAFIASVSAVLGGRQRDQHP